MQNQTENAGPPDNYHYLRGQVALMLDPGNNDGAASSTQSGVGFSNTGPTGTADDITLATGSLVSGTFTFGAPNSGIRSIGDFVQTFQPAAGEGGFFVSPVSPHDMIELIDTTYATTPPEIIMGLDPSDPTLTISMLNGGSTVVDFTVPEPASILLLGSGLIGLAALRHRARNCRPRLYILKSFGRRRRTKVADERTRGKRALVYGECDFWPMRRTVRPSPLHVWRVASLRCWCTARWFPARTAPRSIETSQPGLYPYLRICTSPAKRVRSSTKLRRCRYQTFRTELRPLATSKRAIASKGHMTSI